jgi:hypothetical protein
MSGDYCAMWHSVWPFGDERGRGLNATWHMFGILGMKEDVANSTCLYRWECWIGPHVLVSNPTST